MRRSQQFSRVKNFEEKRLHPARDTPRRCQEDRTSAFSSPRKKGVYAINIDEGDEVIAARLTKESQQMMLFTKNGMAVRFDQGQVRSMGRVARGVRGATLRNGNDAIVSCEIVNGTESLLVVCTKGFGKRSWVEDFRKTNRGGVGVRSIITNERNGLVVGAVSVTDKDGVVMMSNTGQTLRINMNDVRVMGRSTQGVRLVNLHEGDYLVGVQKIEHLETVEETVPAVEEQPQP